MISLIFIQYMPLPIQVRTLSKLRREVLFIIKQ